MRRATIACHNFCQICRKQEVFLPGGERARKAQLERSDDHGCRPRLRVAAATVSRALSQPGRVNAQTAQRILLTAQQMGYRPNPITRALPSGRTLMLALLVPDVTNPFFSELIRGAERQAAAAGYTLVLADTDESPEVESVHAERLARMVDGLVVGTPRLPGQRIAALASTRPLVLVNGAVRGVPNVVIDTPGGMS
jgi:LacI family transcriptional regulator, repressor for deo operon, udp, cdd, tsx, nupC, and nupG